MGIPHETPAAELAILRLSLSASPPHTKAPIPTLIASFLSDTHFHILISHAPGGDLWSYLEQHNSDNNPDHGAIPERLVQRWTAELILAIEWLHSNNWAHRDIKPHNLLLSSTGRLLLTDFNSAAPLLPDSLHSIANEHARALVGTPDYIAPEVLLHAERIVEDSLEEDRSREEEEDSQGRAYGVEVDWWGVGVVVFELLYGQTPFYTESIAGTYERIVNWKNHLKFPSQVTSVSSTAQDFITSLLTDAADRPSSTSLKQHPWFSSTPWSTLLSRSSPPFLPSPSS
ncbi:hypothetical protein RQP46_004112 [Phenoliferia psychrophenolica]